MGLGLHGGGLSSARWFVEHGADVTITDLKEQAQLEGSLNKLSDLPRERLRYTLGQHEEIDFLQADMVIKNPAVPKKSPFLQLAKRVETDISIFLGLNKRPVIAVTGSKGKSTVVSAIYHTMKEAYPETKLGGNITVNPLSFADDAAVEREDPVILELSSWQLGDLSGRGILKPKIAVITNIMHDHQNSYPSMEAYVSDKALIYADQDDNDYTILYGENPWFDRFQRESSGRIVPVYHSPPASGRNKVPLSAWIDPEGEGLFAPLPGPGELGSTPVESLLPPDLALPGRHNRLNLLFAATVLRLFGLPAEKISRGLSRFPGIAHRLELVCEKRGVRWYNDSTATIPEACAGALESFSEPIILICGGTDKKLDFTELEKVIEKPKAIILLEGTATDRLLLILEKRRIPYTGPFPALKEAVDAASAAARRGDVVLFSPGATSFGMFVNEFDRGEQFRSLASNR